MFGQGIARAEGQQLDSNLSAVYEKLSFMHKFSSTFQAVASMTQRRVSALFGLQRTHI
jgi:hypothetical protein